jgi:elongation factor P--beta-lysine ligase
MNRAEYDRYIADFNARDYAAVLSRYADTFELYFAGYVFRTREQVLNFYTFLHRHVEEQVIVHRFVADSATVALEADVILHAVNDLTPAMLAAEGFDRLVPLRRGETVTIPQFIHYHLEKGEIVRALCAVCDSPRP